MQDLYPAPPANPPADLARPGPGYRRRAWLAMAGLGLFVLLYLSLSAWFVWTAYTTFAILRNGGHVGIAELLVAGCSTFLAVFMLKAVFFIKRGEKDTSSMEITEQAQPRLFAFLNRLADEAGAPRPHRVFLSPRVNACVFYDLSILNLLWPSRKNLEIGMGLVNILSVTEFKAVCAHEFGHFAQRSMAVGRWVYMAQQIAGHIVARRDMLDTFLEKISHIDIRVAWVGWLLRLIVWSLRSLIDTAFTLVVLAQRSLSREMELQADLVAVSLTGSDALINALYRLQAADDAWDRALNFVGGELRSKRIPEDVFPLQTHILQRMGELLDNPKHGLPPQIPASDPQSFRVFKPELAQPPRMWATHPFSHEREANAKKIYLAAEDEPTSAWALFDKPEEIRRTVTHNLYRQPEGEPCSAASCLENIDLQFQREHLSRNYRGVYYGRSPMRAASSVADLYGEMEGAEENLGKLYPETISADLEQCETLERELALLENLRNGRLDATGGVIQHRGARLSKHELPNAISQVQSELAAVRQRISAHDQLCRTAHRAAASRLGKGWEAYLVGLAAALHYADHSLANLHDAQRALRNTIAIATATGRVSKANHARVVLDAGTVYNTLDETFKQASRITLNERLLGLLEVQAWSEVLGKLELSPPTAENIGDWLKICDSWIDHTTSALGTLQRRVLDELLLSENRVATWYRLGEAEEEAPEPIRVEARYPVLLPGRERQLQTRLGWWERFLTADGLLASTARLVVALGIVGAVLLFGTLSGQSKVAVHNGLGRTIRVDIGQTSTRIAPFSNFEIKLTPGSQQDFAAYTESGDLIEHFVARIERSTDTQIYNVAGAAPLTEWTASYGGPSGIPAKMRGAARWLSTSADHVFTEPPRSVSGRGSQTRLVLEAPGQKTHPDIVLQALNDTERGTVILAHARWDESGTPYLMNWMSMLPPEQQRSVAKIRLHDNPKETIALRVEQDAAEGTPAHAGICQKDSQLALANPDNPDLQYIAARCLPDQGSRDKAFLDGHAKHPASGWMAFAAGYVYAEQMNWEKALSAMKTARRVAPELAGLVAYDMARVYRMTNASSKVSDDLPLQDAPMLETMQAIEENRLPGEADPDLRAWAALAHGKLEEALRLSRGSASEHTIVRMAACSEGASTSLIRQALNLPTDDGLSSNTRPMMLALAIREHFKTTPFVPAGQTEESKLAITQQHFLELAREGRFGEAELALTGLHPQLRGQTLAMGVVLLGRAAPTGWRDAAKHLLFATERPWLN